MLATAIHMMQGTPFIYQGEEIGMTNPDFASIDDYRDVEALNVYRILGERGLSENERMKIIRQKSRDNARTPMQWDDSPNGGFTTGTPWIAPAPNYKEINVKKALADPKSIFYHYRELIRLRKTYEIITTGTFELLEEGHPDVFAYLRNSDREKLLVVNNFRRHETLFTLPDTINVDGWQTEVLISNYEDSPTHLARLKLRPYESIVYRLTK